MIKVAINGFGRIGRVLARTLLKDKNFQIILINDIYDQVMMNYLFNHDSIYANSSLNLDNITLTSHKNIKDIDFRDIDIVFECSGVYNDKKQLQTYIKNGAKNVIVTAYLKDLPMFIVGVNEKSYKGENIISNTSCTANCAVPILKIIDDHIGINRCTITTIHSYTSEQNLLDNKNKDLRRTRSAPNNIIPLDSNVATATLYFLPHLKDKIYSKSIRVPVTNSVVIDLHISLSLKANIPKIEKILSEFLCNKTTLFDKGYIVSKDITHTKYSSIIDKSFIQLSDNNFLRIMLWQDNEYAYVQRVIDLAKIVSK